MQLKLCGKSIFKSIVLYFLFWHRWKSWCHLLQAYRAKMFTWKVDCEHQWWHGGVLELRWDWKGWMKTLVSQCRQRSFVQTDHQHKGSPSLTPSPRVRDSVDDVCGWQKRGWVRGVVRHWGTFGERLAESGGQETWLDRPGHCNFAAPMGWLPTKQNRRIRSNLPSQLLG